jgi:hypothetical protein
MCYTPNGLSDQTVALRKASLCAIQQEDTSLLPVILHQSLLPVILHQSLLPVILHQSRVALWRPNTADIFRALVGGRGAGSMLVDRLALAPSTAFNGGGGGSGGRGSNPFAGYGVSLTHWLSAFGNRLKVQREDERTKHNAVTDAKQALEQQATNFSARCEELAVGQQQLQQQVEEEQQTNESHIHTIQRYEYEILSLHGARFQTYFVLWGCVFWSAEWAEGVLLCPTHACCFEASVHMI